MIWRREAMGHTARKVPIGPAVLLALALAAASPAGGANAASDWTAREFARFRLVSEATATAGGGDVLIGLEVDLGAGWVFSAEAPGDFGVAPVFDWSASRNLAEARPYWPSPERVAYSETPPVSLRGYREALLLPIVATVVSGDRDLELRLRLDYALCHDYCIVDTVELRLALPAGAGEATLHGPELRRALAEAKAFGE